MTRKQTKKEGALGSSPASRDGRRFQTFKKKRRRALKTAGWGAGDQVCELIDEHRRSRRGRMAGEKLSEIVTTPRN